MLVRENFNDVMYVRYAKNGVYLHHTYLSSDTSSSLILVCLDLLVLSRDLRFSITCDITPLFDLGRAVSSVRWMKLSGRSMRGVGHTILVSLVTVHSWKGNFMKDLFINM